MTNKTDIEQLFRKHYGQMYRLANILLHDENVSRDIVHDVFASLLEGMPATPVTGSYLLKAVRNRALNHIRNCAIHDRIIKLYFLDNEEYDKDDFPDEEMLALINYLIDTSISPQARRIMKLRFSEGLAFAKIAGTIGISETAIYRHISHALTIIRQKINQNG